MNFRGGEDEISEIWSLLCLVPCFQASSLFSIRRFQPSNEAFEEEDVVPKEEGGGKFLCYVPNLNQYR